MNKTPGKDLAVLRDILIVSLQRRIYMELLKAQVSSAP